jgi:hypothetical protein
MLSAATSMTVSSPRSSGSTSYARKSSPLETAAGAQVRFDASRVKLLLDQNLSPSLVQSLVALYPGTAHVRDVSRRPTTTWSGPMPPSAGSSSSRHSSAPRRCRRSDWGAGRCGRPSIGMLELVARCPATRHRPVRALGARAVRPGIIQIGPAAGRSRRQATRTVAPGRFRLECPMKDTMTTRVLDVRPTANETPRLLRRGRKSPRRSATRPGLFVRGAPGACKSRETRLIKRNRLGPRRLGHHNDRVWWYTPTAYSAGS